MFEWIRQKIPTSVFAAGPSDSRLAALLAACLDEAATNEAYYNLKIGDIAASKPLLETSPSEQVVILRMLIRQELELIRRMRGPTISMRNSATDMSRFAAAQQLMSQLLRRKLPFQESDLLDLLKTALRGWKDFYIWQRPYNGILGAIERTYAEQPLPAGLLTQVKRITELVESGRYEYAEERELADRARLLAGDKSKPALKGDFNWSKRIISELETMPGKEQLAWKALVDHALTATSSKPSKKWLAAAREWVESIGHEGFAVRLNGWITALAQEKSDDLPLKNDTNATILRGLVWTATLVPPKLVARDIKLLAIYCFRKISNVGAVSTKVGNACLFVLGELPGIESVSMLNELMQKMKYPSARQLIEKALDAAAMRNNMSRDDLDELSVPDFGLASNGQLHRAIGDVTAVIEVAPDCNVDLMWCKTSGKLQKTLPASIKDEHAAEIKELKKLVADIRSTLQAHTSRIEKLFLRPQPWSYGEWRARYLDHPLLQHITRKLIWQLDSSNSRLSVILVEGRLVDAGRNEITVHDSATVVRLWHPVLASTDEVLAWRKFIYSQGMTQPFKQAHREVYLLTDAERLTEHYSNRFAAHILKQHQMNALCQQRSWRYRLQGDFDSWNAPTLELPQWDITIEFNVEGVEDSINDTGIYNYLSSDQVRFARGGELLRLEEVDPMVFTEVMRDVDLFVGVCSIGNDPGWRDSGTHPGFDEYWHNYSFGDLLESANTRREVLLQLLPKLKIATQCEINDRFLVVRGHLRTYKIHLGSGNILMEPNDQYLCIVEGRSSGDSDARKLVLPFEGDHRMAVILSKAFLLANDNKIADRSILTQINRK